MDADELRSRTKAFASRVIRVYSALPNTAPARVIGYQMLSSATSIGANYRAACRARSRDEFVARLGIVVETVYWLELLADNGIMEPKRLRDLLGEANELTAIFSSARNHSHQKKSQVTNRKSPVPNG